MKLSSNKKSCFGEQELLFHLSYTHPMFSDLHFWSHVYKQRVRCVVFFRFMWNSACFVITFPRGSQNKGMQRLPWNIDFSITSPALKRFLLYVRRSEIRGVDIDNPYMNVMTALTVPDIDDVTVVDYDAQEERIYWADIKTQTIKRAFINGTQLETIISAGECNPDINMTCKVKAVSVMLHGSSVYQRLLISYTHEWTQCVMETYHGNPSNYCCSLSWFSGVRIISVS